MKRKKNNFTSDLSRLVLFLNFLVQIKMWKKRASERFRVAQKKYNFFNYQGNGKK